MPNPRYGCHRRCHAARLVVYVNYYFLQTLSPFHIAAERPSIPLQPHSPQRSLKATAQILFICGLQLWIDQEVAKAPKSFDVSFRFERRREQQLIGYTAASIVLVNFITSAEFLKAGVDLPPILRQMVKTHFSANGEELSHGIVS
jgi:hypothetical protein